MLYSLKLYLYLHNYVIMWCCECMRLWSILQQENNNNPVKSLILELFGCNNSFFFIYSITLHCFRIVPFEVIIVDSKILSFVSDYRPRCYCRNFCRIFCLLILDIVILNGVISLRRILNAFIALYRFARIALCRAPWTRWIDEMYRCCNNTRTRKTESWKKNS